MGNMSVFSILRSANRSNGNNCWNRNTSGNLNNNNANNTNRCLPDRNAVNATRATHSAATHNTGIARRHIPHRLCGKTIS